MIRRHSLSKAPFYLIPSLLIVILSLIFTSNISSTYAYFIDQKTVQNQFTPGNLTTNITEDFPPITPIPEDEDSAFPKKVQISNAAVTSGSVDCYVRAKILFSNNEIGDLTELVGMDSSLWILRSDGYYYYNRILPAGASTEPLFREVMIHGSYRDDQKLSYAEDFDIQIYEESIQAEGFTSYEAAWNHYLAETGGNIG